MIMNESSLLGYPPTARLAFMGPALAPWITLDLHKNNEKEYEVQNP